MINQNISQITGRVAGPVVLKPHRKQDGSEGYRGWFRVAVTRIADLGKPFAEQRASFIQVVVWDKAAQLCAQFLKKGTEVGVTGELISQSRLRTNTAGQTIMLEGRPLYQEFFYIQPRSITDVQFGRPSMKNASPQDLVAQVNALHARITALAAGHPTPTPAAAAPATATATPAIADPLAALGLTTEGSSDLVVEGLDETSPF